LQQPCAELPIVVQYNFWENTVSLNAGGNALVRCFNRMLGDPGRAVIFPLPCHK
jgi:hypothetical protein